MFWKPTIAVQGMFTKSYHDPVLMCHFNILQNFLSQATVSILNTVNQYLYQYKLNLLFQDCDFKHTLFYISLYSLGLGHWTNTFVKGLNTGLF